MIGIRQRIGSVTKNTYFTTGLMSTTSRRKNPRPRFFVKTSLAKKCRRWVTFLATTIFRRRFDGMPRIFSEEENDVAFYGTDFDFLRSLLFSSVFPVFGEYEVQIFCVFIWIWPIGIVYLRSLHFIFLVTDITPKICGRYSPI